MNVQTSTLPTHIALVVRRLGTTSPDELASTFLEAFYLAEVVTKTIAVALQAGLSESAPDIPYRHAYGLVRADGLGIWDQAIRESTSQPIAAYLPPELSQFVAWASKRRTKPEDEWFRDALSKAQYVLKEAGAEVQESSKAASVRDLIGLLIQIRNKTKAHGAVGQTFYANVNKPYLDAVEILLTSCPAMAWKWLHLSVRQSGKIRGILLRGHEPAHLKEAETIDLPVKRPGVHFAPGPSNRVFYCGDLLRGNHDCNLFLFPNGSVAASGQAEFIDYATGSLSKETVDKFLAHPVPPPPSETEGASAFDVQSNVFGNLPDVPRGYVSREALEAELLPRLKDTNHPIITLHGGGGMGKTSLAIYVAHKMTQLVDPPFEHIVWFSARDIDLRLSGPSAVRPSVFDLASVSKKFSELFSSYGVRSDAESFAKVLQSPTGVSRKGILFVFDNFETMSDVREFHRFLDEHTHLPNKVLITSRERAFKADYPIEVRGMELREAELIDAGSS